MITFDQEQAHFLNIAVAHMAQKLAISTHPPRTDPATVMQLNALQTLTRQQATAKALLLTVGPQSNPPTVHDFRDNPRLPTLIDGFISRNTCHAIQKAGAPEADEDLVALLSLSRYCAAPKVAQAAGTFDDLARMFRAQRHVVPFLHHHRADVNDHYHSILDAGRTSQEAIIIAYQPLIERIAGNERMYGDMQLDDRQQEARLGLIKAMQKFDHRRQNRFSSYATSYVSSTISRASLKQGYPIYEPEIARQNRNRVLQQDPHKRPEDPAPNSTSLEAALQPGDRSPSTRLLLSIVDTDPEGNPEFQAEINEMKRLVHLIMRRALNEQQRTILAMRFGIDHPRPYSRYEVARSFGIRDSTVKSIERQAITRFRQAAEHALADYI